MAHKDFKDLHGKIFSRLTVLKYNGQNKNKKSLWLCKCECGKEVTVMGSAMISGHTNSCGCYSKDKAWLTSHRMTKTRIYGIWEGIKARCLNENNSAYKDYGGRGINICSEWVNFIDFKAWAFSNGYAENLTIERKNVNGNYEPNNCTWLTNAEQAWNRTNTVKIIIDGAILNIKEVANKYNLKESLVRQRCKKGWSVEEIISPVKKKRLPWKKNLKQNLEIK